MALINNALEGCDGFAIVYMDDILIYSTDEKTHLNHFEIIFKKLKKAKLKIKISKCSFLKKTSTLLTTSSVSRWNIAHERKDSHN